MPRKNGLHSHSSQNFLELKPRRHQRWYERILLNTPLGYLLALALILILPFYLTYGHWAPGDTNQMITQAVLAGTFVIAVLVSRALVQYPGGNLIGYRLAITILAIGLALVVITVFRLGYARLPLFLGFLLILVIQVVSYMMKGRFRYTKFALVPGGAMKEPPEQEGYARFFLLEDPHDRRRFDALVVDMEAEPSDEWVRFIAWHNSRRIPLLNGKYLHESLHGCVSLEQLKITDLEFLQPDAFYLLSKRLLDIVGTLLVLPVAIPLMLVIAIAVRLESRGPALFIQERVGAGNQPFRMFKFRSMRVAKEPDDSARFANEDDYRITRLGRFLRRSRLDELPQLCNVLVGHMSLIGPRPEQPLFAQSFDDQVPYYRYRHIIKPGITGWAQVQQGYVCGLADTHQKVEHDFYYIKHLGFSLDTLIAMKTVRTILTGFGAR